MLQVSQMGERWSGEHLIAIAAGGDALGIEPQCAYKRVRESLNSTASIAVGAGGRRHHFAQVDPDGLTARQIDVLSVINRSLREYGFSPTIREIGRALGIKSTNGVNDHIRALVRKGRINRAPLKSRSLVLCNAVDWQARALRAEAEVERLRAQLEAQAA